MKTGACVSRSCTIFYHNRTTLVAVFELQSLQHHWVKIAFYFLSQKLIEFLVWTCSRNAELTVAMMIPFVIISTNDSIIWSVFSITFKH